MSFEKVISNLSKNSVDILTLQRPSLLSPILIRLFMI